MVLPLRHLLRIPKGFTMRFALVTSALLASALALPALAAGKSCVFIYRSFNVPELVHPRVVMFDGATSIPDIIYFPLPSKIAS